MAKHYHYYQRSHFEFVEVLKQADTAYAELTREKDEAFRKAKALAAENADCQNNLNQALIRAENEKT